MEQDKECMVLPDLGIGLLVDPIFWQPLPRPPYYELSPSADGPKHNMTGTYLECDLCKKHFDLEQRCGGFNQRAAQAGWIEVKRNHIWDCLHFCCEDHRTEFLSVAAQAEEKK